MPNKNIVYTETNNKKVMQIAKWNYNLYRRVHSGFHEYNLGYDLRDIILIFILHECPG